MMTVGRRKANKLTLTYCRVKSVAVPLAESIAERPERQFNWSPGRLALGVEMVERQQLPPPQGDETFLLI